MRYPVIVAAALVLAGCATVVQTVPFNEADFSPYAGAGKAAIRGHAFVHTQDGAKHNAAGLKVYLMPLTPYTDERAKIMESGKDPAPADPRLDKYTQVMTADVGGFFEFGGLPAGRYVVYSRIEWNRWGWRPDASGDYYVVGETAVRAGETKRLVVTNSGQ